MLKALAILCAFILPPLGVLLGNGSLGDILINILLCMFFWLPGIVHALYVIFKN